MEGAYYLLGKKKNPSQTQIKLAICLKKKKTKKRGEMAQLPVIRKSKAHLNLDVSLN